MSSNQPAERHDHKTLKFPEGFLWGAATSAHQVEGNNIYNDWWDWEQTQPPHLRSGGACDQYNRYEQDFELAKSLNHNTHRLSIDWSRIEPKENEWNYSEIEHYKKVLRSLKTRNFTVMLTLWHFTLPLWLSQKGGWENSKIIDYFGRFVQKIVPELKEYVDLWITLNEPGVYVFMGYLGGDDVGRWPPLKRSNFAALKVSWNLAQAHKQAYRIIHKILPSATVGIAQNVSSFEAYHKHSLLEMLAVGLSDLFTNHSFYFLTQGYHDFLGLNYYFHRRFNLEKGIVPKIVSAQEQGEDISDLGWEVYPEGIFDVLADLSDGLPIYITECGIASTNDDRRNRFLITYLQEVYRAIKAGVNIKGFIYWSLIDNFEWHRGFDPRFGLIEIDYSNQKRIIRPSAKVFAEIIKENGLPHTLLRFIGHTVQAKEVLDKLDHQLSLNPEAKNKKF